MVYLGKEIRVKRDSPLLEVTLLFSPLTRLSLQDARSYRED